MAAPSASATFTALTCAGLGPLARRIVGRKSRTMPISRVFMCPRISGDVELVRCFRLRRAPVGGRADAVVIAAVQGDPQCVTLARRRRSRELDVPSVELLVPHTVHSSD